jgi:hypothetical protein
MSNANLRRADCAGLIIKKCRKGKVLVDAVTGESLYVGNRSGKCWHSERRIEAFFRRRERGGLG